MTEPETTEAAAEGTQRAGRPRPTEVMERDQRVYDYLLAMRNEDGTFQGKSREEVAGALELEGKQVYLSFYRLKRDGKIVKGGAAGAQKWTALAPAETVTA